MALQIGRHEVTITDNDLAQIGDKSAVRIGFEMADGTVDSTLIWLTQKSMGMARRALKLCGHDVDADGLAVLGENNAKLRGHKVSVLIEEYNGKLRAQIELNAKPDASEIQKLERGLREAKKKQTEDDDDIPF